MIIWLASYPKSGNTWVRLFLDNLLQKGNDFNINKNIIGQFPIRSHFEKLSNNINDQGEFAKYCIKAQENLNLKDQVKIFKTHNAYWNWGNGKHTFTDEKNTLGVIYIVRDPRNVVTSILNYFHKKNYEEAVEFLRENKVLGGDESEIGLPTIVGSWSNHYKSWKKFKKNYLLIKYENLLNNPLDEFTKITNYLKTITNFKFEEEKLLNQLKTVPLKIYLSKKTNLVSMITQRETKKKREKFFNLGPKNRWEIILDEEIKRKIEFLFQDEMKELRYL